MPIKKEKLDAINGYREYQARKKKEQEEQPKAGSSSSSKTASTGTQTKQTTGTTTAQADKKAVVKKEKLDAIAGYREWQAKRTSGTSRNATDNGRMAQLSVQLQTAREQERAARTKANAMLRSGSWKADNQAEREAAQKDYEAKSAARKALEAEIENLQYQRKYEDKVYDDTFTGQFGANYTAGRMQQDSSIAWNNYLNDPTEENRVRAQAIDALMQQFQSNNEASLDDKGAVLPWVSKSAANYLPQLVDQTKYSTVGGLGGAVAGAAIPVVGPVMGAKAGIVAGSGVYSYNTMRGAAFKGLLELGADEETARAAANDEAVISSLIEMADTGVDIATLGVGKLLTMLGKGGAKAVAGKAAESAAKKLIKGLAGYGLNIAGEMLEEGTQEAVSIANERRMGTGESGILGLAKDATGTFVNAVTGENAEDRARVWEAAKEGGKIAAMMGGATRVATGVTNTAIENQVGKQFNNMGQESVQAVIDTGLESDKNSESYKMASALKDKQDKGKTITNREIGRLYQENVKTVEAEQAQTRTAERKTIEQQVKKETGYGEYGTKAFVELMDTENMPREQLRTRFQTAYEAGLTDMPTAKANLTTYIQRVAFNAGKQDYIMSSKRDANTSKYATVYGKESGFIQTDAAKGVDQATIDTLNAVSKALGMKSRFVESVFGGQANGSMSSDGILSIAKDAVNPYFVVTKHEVTHRMQQLAPTQYTAYRNYAVQLLAAERGDTATTLVESYQNMAADNDVTLTTEQAMDEIAADFTERILTDEDALRQFAEDMSQTREKRTVAQKFFDAVREFIRKVKSVFHGDKAKMDSAAAHEFGATVEQLEKAEKLWQEAFRAAQTAANEITRQEARTASSGQQGAKAAASVKSEAAELSDSDLQYSIRKKDPPKKTGIAYKVFYAKDGQLYPPMVANPGGEGTPVGVWLDADIGQQAAPSKTGRPQVQGGGKGTNAGKMSLAFRPGWHLGDVPLAKQFARKNPDTGVKDLSPADFVWAECEYAMDVDYQDEAMSYGYTENGKFRHSYAGLPRIPEDGYYRYRTNPNPDTVPWVITGAMRVKRILTDEETDAICRENGVEPMKRQGGPIDLEKYGIKAGDTVDEKFSLKDNGNDTVTNKDGDTVAKFYANGSAQFSLKTYKEDGRANLQNWLDKKVNRKEISRSDADDIVQQLDSFYDICQKFTGKYAPFSAWSNAEVVRDAKGKPVFSVVKANGEYAMNLDFSLVCKKRRTLDAVFREMINRGILDKMDLGEAQIAGINQIIRDSGFETACSLCFVDSKRYRQANVADNFVTQYNDMVKMLIPEGKGIEAHYFDFLERGMKGQGRALDKVSDKEIGKGILKLKQVMQENKKGTVPYKIAWHLLNNPQDRKLLTRSEFMNTDGFEALNVKNKKVLSLYNSSKGSGGPKAALSDVQYLGDILKKNNFTPAKAYSVGGVRIQSFSDYIPRLVFDYLQMTADLTAKKLPAHAYTKEEMFAKQFGMTGIKINMSLVPAVVKDGIAPGLDANGNYVWYDGQSFGSDVNVKGSGQTGFNTAVEIQNAEGYSANCGTIAVGISDEHIWKMLDDPDIRMIIPYHKSSLNHIVAVMNNIDQYNDYTGVQNTRDAKTGTKITGKDFNYNEALRRLGDAKAAANEYLAWCDENGYLPKFDTFAEHENYYKLLEDFSTYDNGEAAPQGAVTMTFPKSGDAFGSMSELIERGLEEDAILEGRRQADVPGIVDKIEAAFNTEVGSKFSLKDQNKLMRENAQLKETVESLREQFKTTKFAQVDKKSLDNFTKQLLKDYKSGAEMNDTREALNGLYTYIANGENGEAPVWDEAYKRAYDVAVSILENSSVIDDEMYREYADLRKYLRTTGMTLDRQYNHDLYGYENYQEFRKAYLGKIKLVKDGIPVDVAYQELAARYPEFFDETRDMNQADMLTTIAETLDRMEPTEINPYSYNIRESATWLANDILERFYELPQAKPTFADKAEQKLTKQVIKDAKKLERVREQKNERIREIIEKNREKVKTVRAEERVKRAEALKEVKTHYKEKERRASNSRKARDLRDKITRHAKDLSDKLLKPTDKQHIPQELQGAVAKLLESINQESNYTFDEATQSYRKNDEGLPTKRTQAFAELKKLYSQMANELVIDPDLLGDDGLLSDVIALADKRLVDMNSEELQTIWNTLRAVEASIQTANKVFSTSKWESISEAAEGLRSDNKGKKEKTEYGGPIGKAQKLTGLDMMTPESFLHRLGSSGDQIFRMLRDAQDAHIRIMKSVSDFTHDALGEVNVRKLERELHDVTLGGEKVKLSTAQIMELYVLSRREQALEHIYVGGILPDVVSASWVKKITKAKPVRGVTMAEVGEVISLLTDDQKAIAEKLQEYVSTELSRYGNEASMKVYNYEKFGEKMYWPIRVNRQETQSDVQKDTATTGIPNRGFTKGTKPHANNSVKLGSIFDTFATHASEMATYAAYLGTMEDVNRIRNYRFLGVDGRTTDTVKAIIDTVHGTRGNDYLQNLLVDITNGVKGTHGETAYMSGIIGNFKAAAVGANLRVIIQQPTAILRAMDMIDPQYLAVGMKPNDGWEKALKYAPIAQWKDWGYFDINTGRQMKDVLFDSDSALDKVKSVSMWGAGKADSISWGLLWNAVEAETKEKRQDLNPGTDDFYQAVSKRFTEIIDHTQVVDGILQRSQIMRSADSLTKMATSFMAEPTKQYNMAVAAAYDAKNATGEQKNVAKRRLARTAVSLVVSGVVNAMAQSIMDAVRDDDKEKEYWEKWLESFFGFTGDEESGKDYWDSFWAGNLGNMVNPAAYIPYAKDVLSIIQGYDVSRMDMESVEKFITASQNMGKALSGEGKYTIGGAAANLFAEAARLIGVPVANLKREVKAFAMLAAVETDNYLMQYRMEKASLALNYAGNSGTFMDILYNAYKNDPEAYNIIYKDMIASGYDPDKLANGMETRMKKDQGVKEVKELDQRYLHPDQQPDWDKTMSSISSSFLWKNATEEQRDAVEEKLYGLVTDSNSSKELQEKLDKGASYGLDETEYLLYTLALDMYDQPNKSGEYGGTPTNEEKADAITAVGGLNNGEIAFLWDTDQGYDLYNNGIDMQAYVEYVGSGGSVNTEKLIGAKDFGMSEEEYFNFLETLKEFDQPTASGKYGTYTQDEATAAIKSITGLSREQRSYLWQSVNNGWKSKNNPWR